MIAAMKRPPKPTGSSSSNPATLKRLIIDLIDPEDWMSLHADVKGDICLGPAGQVGPGVPKGVVSATARATSILSTGSRLGK